MKNQKINISIFVTSRIAGNKNSNLEKLVTSIRDQSFSTSDIEILVKFDDDDRLANDVISKIKKFDITIKYAFGPRKRGYIDIHHGYSQLIPKADNNSKIFICMADDFIVKKNWDIEYRKFIHKCNREFFIIHQRPHPYSDRNFIKLSKYNTGYYGDSWGDIYIIDEAPAWSASLIRLINNFGPISFTDLFTLDLEAKLGEKKINITYFTSNETIYRTLHKDIDIPGTQRWNNDREINMKFAHSENFNYQMKEISELILSKMSFKDKLLSFLRFLYYKIIFIIFKLLGSKYLKYLFYFFGSFHSINPKPIFKFNEKLIVGYYGNFYVFSKDDKGVFDPSVLENDMVLPDHIIKKNSFFSAMIAVFKGNLL